MQNIGCVMGMHELKIWAHGFKEVVYNEDE